MGISPPKQPSRVYVTGAGCVSALGINLSEISRALQCGEPTTRKVTLFSTEGCQCHQAGELSDPIVRAALELHPASESWHRVSRMVLMALTEALNGRTDFLPDAAVFGSTSGGMSFGEDFFRAVSEGRKGTISRSNIREYLPQQAALDVLAFHHWPVSPLIISNACASGTNAIGYACRLVASGLVEQAVCGGYDALSQLVFSGFDCLRALSPTVCRPFSKNRDGLLLGEGAAVLLLESEFSLSQSGRTPLAEVLGYGAASDNYHLTQPEPGGSGPLAAMKSALQQAQLEAGDVDYVNAHGTATPFNDLSEGRAIVNLMPGVPVSSTKALTGHTLGAAGAIEAVLSILALRDGFLPKQANFLEPDEEIPIRIVRESDQANAPRYILSNSFGFGGSNASIILGKPD